MKFFRCQPDNSVVLQSEQHSAVKFSFFFNNNNNNNFKINYSAALFYYYTLLSSVGNTDNAFVPAVERRGERHDKQRQRSVCMCVKREEREGEIKAGHYGGELMLGQRFQSLCGR